MASPENLFGSVYRNDRLQFWRDHALDYKKVADYLNFNAQDVSRIAGVAKASVRYDEKIPTEVRERLELIANICNLVFEHFDDDVKTALWFRAPNPLLGNVSPRDMIRFGRYKKLLRFVTDAMSEGRARGSEQQEDWVSQETSSVSSSK
jgi:hypothetical protein